MTTKVTKQTPVAAHGKDYNLYRFRKVSKQTTATNPVFQSCYIYDLKDPVFNKRLQDTQRKEKRFSSF